MNMEIIVSLLEKYGLPLVILTILVIFIDRRVWPWFTNLIEKQFERSSHDFETLRQRREEDHRAQVDALKTMARSIENLSQSMVSSQHEVSLSIRYMTDQFIETLQQLNAIKEQGSGGRRK